MGTTKKKVFFSFEFIYNKKGQIFLKKCFISNNVRYFYHFIGGF